MASGPYRPTGVRTSNVQPAVKSRSNSFGLTCAGCGCLILRGRTLAGGRALTLLRAHDGAHKEKKCPRQLLLRWGVFFHFGNGANEMLTEKSTSVNGVVPFYFDAQPVRVVTDERGDTWFVASDVCAVLAIADVKQAVERLDDDERGGCNVPTPGGVQQVRAVNESGLYSLILTSRKPEAKRFKRWVTHEVLPAIRKTGRYEAAPQFHIPQTLPEALRLAAELAEQRDVLQAQLSLAAPKAEALDRISTADGSVCITNAAKDLGIPPKRLFSWMNEHLWIYRRAGGGGWVAYQNRIQTGLLEHKVTTVERSDGTTKMVEQVLVTPKGLAKLAQAFAHDGR